jgi:photosystem II stability/assembly factor-like uncharacterized protein
MKYLFLIINLCLSTFAFSQQSLDQNSRKLREFDLQRKDTNFLSSIPFTNVGPTIMSGRVVDLAVNPDHPAEFFVAYATGGLWYTNNNGLSMTCVFEQEATLNIGSFAVNWKDSTIFIGTGEANSSRSSYAGLGIYKSKNFGKSWNHIGLTGTQHIGRILLHGDKIWVASMGSLYTPDGQPGIFVSENGGDHFEEIKIASCGFIDIQVDQKNNLYAIAWERTRKAWEFIGQGANSAIYKSSDGGQSWNCITNGSNGIPKNNGTGRIGLAVSPDNANILYLLLDNQNTISKPKFDAFALQKMSKDSFLKMNDSLLDFYLRDNDYPSKYTAKSTKKDISESKYSVRDIAQWVLSDGGNQLFQSEIIGSQLYRSEDGGLNWKLTHDRPLNGLYFTYGYYFGNIYAANDSTVYLLGYTLIRSNDGGKSFQDISKGNVHADHHKLWINPQDPNHLVDGNDGGVNITFDNGKKWLKANNPAVGQFYAIQVDNATPYNIYGGLQDNGTWVGPSTYRPDDSWHQVGEYPYKELGGGDGMQVQVDSRDNTTTYLGWQFGYYMRKNRKDEEGTSYFHPVHDIGEDALRYNWQSPIWLSQHNSDILYMGSNKFMRSLEQGNHMKIMSRDLAPTYHKGNVPYGTLTTIHESPLQFGLIYVGSDNGKIYKSHDIGVTFEKMMTGDRVVDDQLWVSRIIASKYKLHRLYVAYNGYRNDDFSPYLYRSDDGGKSFTKIGMNLPLEPINVIREDPKKSNIIYVGTDQGLYISYDTGAHFLPWLANLPRVAIHDIAIQERDNEIVLGTHGRSIYKAELKHIQSLPQDSLIEIKIDSIFPVIRRDWGKQNSIYSKDTEPKIKLNYFSRNAGPLQLEILNNNQIVFTQKINCIKGYNSYEYSGISNTHGVKGENGKFYLKKGKYQIRITNNTKFFSTATLIIL